MKEISQIRTLLSTEHVRMFVSLMVYLLMIICFLVVCPGVHRSSRVGDSVFQWHYRLLRAGCREHSSAGKKHASATDFYIISFPGQHTTLSGRQMTLASSKGPLVGRKGHFVGIKRPLSGRHRKISSQHKDLLGRKRVPLPSKQDPSRLVRGLPGQHNALSIERKALLSRKRASCQLDIWPLFRLKNNKKIV